MASNSFVILVLILVTSHYWSIVSSVSLSALPPPPEKDSQERKLNSTVFGQLLQNSHSKKCMFPFNEAEIIQDGPHIRKLNSLCNQTSEDYKKSESGPLCILIADLLSSICDSTENYNLAQYLTPNFTTNVSLSREITQVKDKPVDAVCNELFKATQERRKDSKPDLQNLYATFFPADAQTHKGSCQSVCQINYPEPDDPLGGGDAALKLNPLCIVLNISSIAYNSLVARRLSSSTSQSPPVPSTERNKNNGALDVGTNLGSSASVVVAKRKDPVFLNKNTNEDVKEQLPIKGQSSSAAGSSTPKTPLDKIKHTSKYELRGGMSSSSSSTSSLTDLKDPIDVPPPVIKTDGKNQPSTKASSPLPVINSKDGNPTGDQHPAPDSPSTQNKEPPLDNKYDTAPVQSENTADYEEGGQAGNLEVSDPGDDMPPIDTNNDDDIPNYKQKPNDGDRPADKNNLQDTPNRKETFKYQPNVEVENIESGGYFNYFILFLTILALCFLAFHNKRWLVAYIVEGRKPRGQRSRRRSSSSSGASYRRLENNFE